MSLVICCLGDWALPTDGLTPEYKSYICLFRLNQLLLKYLFLSKEYILDCPFLGQCQHT
jgi:hypothetical protein